MTVVLIFVISVLDLAIHNGYVFVQFDNMQSSLTAIEKLNSTLYRGKGLRKF